MNRNEERFDLPLFLWLSISFMCVAYVVSEIVLAVWGVW